MSQRVEILAGWDGSSLIPLRKYQAICDRELVVGERYIAALEPLSSPASRRHFFACIHELFASWPEAHPRQFQTEDHLRRWALIRCGFRVEQQFAADQPWSGKLIFDRARHKEVMHLPLDYPRINKFPEWFTVQSAKRYAFTGLSDSCTGAELSAGIPVTLRAGEELRLEVSARRGGE